MIAETEHEIAEDLRALQPLLRNFSRWVKAMLVCAFVIGGWVASLEVSRQQTVETKLSVDSLVLWRERINDHIITSRDMSAVTRPLHDSIVVLDMRITRQEDAALVTKETLLRIEKKLDELVKSAR